MLRINLPFDLQNGRLSTSSFAETRKRRGLKHRCLLAFVSARFPPPWLIEELEACFIVSKSNANLCV
jgi:hypothetical protein